MLRVGCHVLGFVCCLLCCVCELNVVLGVFVVCCVERRVLSVRCCLLVLDCCVSGVTC